MFVRVFRVGRFFFFVALQHFTDRCREKDESVYPLPSSQVPFFVAIYFTS